MPVDSSPPFHLAHRITDGRHGIAVGHIYWFAVRDGEIVRWWQHGRMEDVMVPPDEPDSLDEPSGEPIVLMGATPVIFEVENPETAVERQSCSEALRLEPLRHP